MTEDTTNPIPERISAKVHSASTDVISCQHGLIGDWSEHQRDDQTEFIRVDLSPGTSRQQLIQEQSTLVDQSTNKPGAQEESNASLIINGKCEELVAIKVLPDQTKLATRSQAEELLAAERAEISAVADHLDCEADSDSTIFQSLHLTDHGSIYSTVLGHHL